MKRRIARLVNLLLASLLVGNGVGAVVITHPALHTLRPDAYLKAEQELTRRYRGIMTRLMPITVLSCLALLFTTPRRKAAAFRYTLLGTIGSVGMLVTTAVELPLNKWTLELDAAAPPDNWQEMRQRWDRFNRLRTICEVVGLLALCLATLSETDD
jgi:uncharacterized membrane protein